MSPDSSKTSAPALPLWLLLACAAMNLYLLGAATLLQAVQYPLLGEVGSAALPALHASLSRRLGLPFILPEFLAFLSVLPLLRWRPPRVPPGSVWACIALGVVYFAVTFGWHLPAHKLLAGGENSPATLQLLLVSHAVRTASLALKCGLLLWMASVALGGLPASDRQLESARVGPRNP